MLILMCQPTILNALFPFLGLAYVFPPLPGGRGRRICPAGLSDRAPSWYVTRLKLGWARANSAVQTDANCVAAPQIKSDGRRYVRAAPRIRGLGVASGKVCVLCPFGHQRKTGMEADWA